MFTIDSFYQLLDAIVTWTTGFYATLDTIRVFDLGNNSYVTALDFFIIFLILDLIAVFWWLFRGYDEL